MKTIMCFSLYKSLALALNAECANNVNTDHLSLGYHHHKYPAHKLFPSLLCQQQKMAHRLQGTIGLITISPEKQNHPKCIS